MNIRLLTKEQRYDVYYNHMIRDFRPTELKPYDRIEWLVKQGYYDCYGLFHSSSATLMGYAYIAKADVGDNRILNLDFYAICSGHRASGMGSRFIRLLREHFAEQYTALIAEVENPDYGEDEKDYQMRIRRLFFYKRNGFKLTKVLSRVLVDEYRMIQTPFSKTLTDEEIEDAMRVVYSRLYSPEFLKKEIFIRMDKKQDGLSYHGESRPVYNRQ